MRVELEWVWTALIRSDLGGGDVPPQWIQMGQQVGDLPFPWIQTEGDPQLLRDGTMRGRQGCGLTSNDERLAKVTNKCINSRIVMQELTTGEKTVIIWRSLFAVPNTRHVVEFLKERRELFLSRVTICHIHEHSQGGVLDLSERAGFDVAEVVGELRKWFNDSLYVLYQKRNIRHTVIKWSRRILLPDHRFGMKRQIGDTAATTWQTRRSRAKNDLPLSTPNASNKSKNSRDVVDSP